MTHFPQENSSGQSHVDVSSTPPGADRHSLSLAAFENFTIWRNIRHLTRTLGVEICEPVLNHPEVKRIIDGRDERLDLLVVEIFGTRVLLGYRPRFKHTESGWRYQQCRALRWSHEILRNSENPSYIPNWFSRDYTARMSFLERSINTAALILIVKLAYVGIGK